MTGADQTDAVEAGSASVSIGTPVLAWPGTRDVAPMWTTTRTEPWQIGRVWVVSVEDYAGGIALSHIEMVPEDWLRAHDRRVAAEALRSAEDAMGQRLNEFAQGGRHTRARWAQEWLRDRAERVEAGDE